MRAKAGAGSDRKKLVLRLTPERARMVEGYVFVLGRSFQDVCETALVEYLERVKLTPEQARTIKTLR